MPEAAADPVAAVVAILKAAPDAPGGLAGRVFGSELPAGEAAAMPRAGIVVRASGGVSLTSGSYAEHDTMRVDLFAYGQTAALAASLNAWAALQLRRVERVVAAQTLVHWVGSAGGYSSGREPVTEWPRAFQSFQVFHALQAVPGAI